MFKSTLRIAHNFFKKFGKLSCTSLSILKHLIAVAFLLPFLLSHSDLVAEIRKMSWFS